MNWTLLLRAKHLHLPVKFFLSLILKHKNVSILKNHNFPKFPKFPSKSHQISRKLNNKWIYQKSRINIQRKKLHPSSVLRDRRTRRYFGVISRVIRSPYPPSNPRQRRLSLTADRDKQARMDLRKEEVWAPRVLVPLELPLTSKTSFFRTARAELRLEVSPLLAIPIGRENEPACMRFRA